MLTKQAFIYCVSSLFMLAWTQMDSLDCLSKELLQMLMAY